jgi:hypothetical protein
MRPPDACSDVAGPGPVLASALRRVPVLCPEPAVRAPQALHRVCRHGPASGRGCHRDPQRSGAGGTGGRHAGPGGRCHCACAWAGHPLHQRLAALRAVRCRARGRSTGADGLCRQVRGLDAAGRPACLGLVHVSGVEDPALASAPCAMATGCWSVRPTGSATQRSWPDCREPGTAVWCLLSPLPTGSHLLATSRPAWQPARAICSCQWVQLPDMAVGPMQLASRPLLVGVVVALLGLGRSALLVRRKTCGPCWLQPWTALRPRSRSPARSCRTGCGRRTRCRCARRVSSTCPA